MKTEAKNRRESIYRILSYNMSDDDRDKFLNLIDNFAKQDAIEFETYVSTRYERFDCDKYRLSYGYAVTVGQDYFTREQLYQKHKQGD